MKKSQLFDFLKSLPIDPKNPDPEISFWIDNEAIAEYSNPNRDVYPKLVFDYQESPFDNVTPLGNYDLCLTFEKR